MDYYDIDIYAEFVPTMHSTTSRSQCEDALVELYRIGELPLSELVNFCKENYLFRCFFVVVEIEAGSW